MTRDDVTSTTASVTTTTRYDIAGSVVARLDPLGRKVRVEYTDNFNQTGTTYTYAYPTKVFDPAGNFSEVGYRMDIGANVWAQSPAPAGQSVGKTTERKYDEIGRLDRETILNTGAYTRYWYPDNGVQRQVYSTIVDVGNDGVDSGDEVLTESWTDGAGRVRYTRVPHTFSGGSTSTWAATVIEYDILGRVKRQSVPTEVDSVWDPAGDDQSRGFLWTVQKYDWMGRVVRKINTDGEDSGTLNDSDVLISYAGCGCAGGLETTILGELVPKDDGSGNARRKQKVYADILGRTYKTETYVWETTTVYSTVVNSFNQRDQVLRSRQFAGDESSSTYQDTLAIFDGHGRLSASHRPEQRDGSDNPAYTTYTYNADDSIATVTDARGATATYSYDTDLGLLLGISYSVPQGSNIPVTPTVSFNYDDIGNRTQMADGSGTTTYQYDELSRITQETKQFTGRTGSFTLQYIYELGGQGKKIDIPNGTSINYNHDKTGRVASISGQEFEDDRVSYDIDNIVPSIQYRAWGGPKSIDVGSSVTTTISYNERLQAAEFRIPGLIEVDLDYGADGQVRFQDNLLDATFDRSYEYDHRSRVVKAKSGAEASGGTQMTGPYRQTFGYNAFDNITLRDTMHWSENYNYGFQATYSGNRRNNWNHDADGNVTSDQFDQMKFEFDADGGNTVTEYPVIEDGNLSTHRTKTLHYDGDGTAVIEEDVSEGYQFTSLRHTLEIREYNLKSTPLGGMIVYKLTDRETWSYPSTNANSFRQETRVFLGDKLLATGDAFWSSGTQDWDRRFYWTHTDPTATTIARSDINPSGGAYKHIMNNLDPMGADVGFAPPEEPEPQLPSGQQWEFGSPEAVDWIEVDGISAPANHWGPGMLASASRCPSGGCGARRTENGWEYWTAFADGYEGWLPTNAIYEGHGDWFVYEFRPTRETRNHPDIHLRPRKIRPESNSRLLRRGNQFTMPSSQRKDDPQVEEEKLKSCVKDLFNVDTSSYVVGESFRGVSDYYDGLNGGLMWILDALLLFTVDRSAISVTSEKVPLDQIKFRAGSLFNPIANAKPVVGYTFPSGKTNLVVNDLGTQGFMDSIWVYELGNALGIQTGYHPIAEDEERRYDNLGANDKGGPALVDCVMGGRVDNFGRVSPPPSARRTMILQ